MSGVFTQSVAPEGSSVDPPVALNCAIRVELGWQAPYLPDSAAQSIPAPSSCTKTVVH
jgi:hypothetical protein